MPQFFELTQPGNHTLPTSGINNTKMGLVTTRAATLQPVVRGNRI